MRTIRPEAMKEFKGRVIDVRSPEEYSAKRLGCTENVPLGQLPTVAGQWNRGEPILVMCKGGTRSRLAAEQLEAAGFTEVANLEGGIDGCVRAGLPVEGRGPGIPLFRQQMIGIGIMFLVLLALVSIHPAFFYLLWVMAGLVVISGITGFCLLGKVLTLMPWNRQVVCQAGTTLPRDKAEQGSSSSCCGSK